jgi:hypothetical protein
MHHLNSRNDATYRGLGRIHRGLRGIGQGRQKRKVFIACHGGKTKKTYGTFREAVFSIT